MEEAHTVWHQIINLLGVKQCTATQVLGICLEFWVGAAVALGALKIRVLIRAKNELEKLKGRKKSAKKKSKIKKKKRTK